MSKQMRIPHGSNGVVFLSLQRQFIEGLTEGGLKT
jgi:ABC-type maltose transport system permease subunit